MEDKNKRLFGETIEEYRIRRKREEYRLKNYLRGKWFFISASPDMLSKTYKKKEETKK